MVAAAIVGGAVIGAAASSSSASKQSKAADRASNLQMDQYQQTRTDQAPWRQAGSTALSTIADMQPQFQHQFNAEDLKGNLAPNYAWRLAQGQAANQNAAGVGGGLVGGNALKGLQDYTQNAAGDAYQQAFNNYNAQQTNIFNRLSTIAGLGSTANQTTAQAGTAAANNAGNYLTSGAAASAAGTVGAANAVNNGIGNYLGWNYLNKGSSGDLSANDPSGYGINGAGGAASAGDYSDRRLKTHIVRIGRHALGIGFYRYTISGISTVGVMADEVESVMPEAVRMMPNGFKFVDYQMIGGRRAA